MTSFRELTGVLDKFSAGDTVTVTVVRYNNVYPMTNSNNGYYGNNPFGSFFGGFGYGYGYGNGNSGSSGQSSPSASDLVVGGGYDFVTVDVTLELPTETDD